MKGRTRSSVLLILYLCCSWVQTAAWGHDPHLEEEQVKWGYVKEMIDNISATARQRTMAYSAEIGMMLDKANATMQAFHARSLANFRELTANSTTVNAEYLQRQWRSLNRALHQQALLPPRERFTVLHHTDSLGLHRLYRVMRAQEQLEALGHAYAVLYRRPHDVVNGTDAHLETLRALLPGLNVLVFTDEKNDAVALARSWLRANGSTSGGTADSGIFWLLGLDVEWVGSLPHVLTSLGRDRARRGPLAVMSVGCVDEEKDKGPLASGGDTTATGTPAATGDALALGKGSMMRQQLRMCRRLLARAVAKVRLTLHWFVARLWGRAIEAPKRSCPQAIFAVSRALLAGDMGNEGGDSAVAELFNAALASEGTRAAARDATHYGVTNSLLHPDFLHAAECRDCGSSEDGSNGTLSRPLFSSIKEGYVKQVMLPFSPGLLVRCADKCDYDNDA